MMLLRELIFQKYGKQFALLVSELKNLELLFFVEPTLLFTQTILKISFNIMRSLVTSLNLSHFLNKVRGLRELTMASIPNLVLYLPSTNLKDWWTSLGLIQISSTSLNWLELVNNTKCGLRLFNCIKLMSKTTKQSKRWLITPQPLLDMTFSARVSSKSQIMTCSTKLSFSILRKSRCLWMICSTLL